jgi:hypothetical protein
MAKSSHEEMIAALRSGCVANEVLKSLTEDEVVGLVEVLVAQQFAASRKTSQTKLRGLVEAIVDRLAEGDS